MAFNAQRCDARARHIPFQLDFDFWLSTWLESGHLHQRGRHKGCYVLGRIDDSGGYVVGNVSILRAEENVRQAHKGIHHAFKAPHH